MNQNKISLFLKLFYIVTSIGTITHEIAHVLACCITKTEINKICLFRVPKNNTDSLGYVDHENVTGYMSFFLVNISPFFVGSFLSIISYIIMLYLIFIKSSPYNPYVFLWLGFSFGLFALPSRNEFREFDKYALGVLDVYMVGIKLRLCFSNKQDILSLLHLSITAPIIIFIELVYSSDYKKYTELIYSLFLLLIALVICTISLL